MPASIIFDNRESRLTLPDILGRLQQAPELRCEMSEWRFGASVIPQIRIATTPPIALQLDEAPEIVPEEIQELLDDHGHSLGVAALAAARGCRSRLNVVGCEGAWIRRLPEGGILVHAPDAALDSASVQLALRQVAAIVHGWIFDNGNGRWLHVN